MRLHRKLAVLFILVVSIVACSKVPPFDLFKPFERPSYFPEPGYRLEANPITEEGFKLGKNLFYDPLLSADNTISCGSCHIQTAAFTQHGHSVSHGIKDRLGTRNSQPIMNLAWNTSFMWDGGVFDLDLQPIVPITNHVEMDNTMEEVLKKLNASASYRDQFRQAFGSEEITGVLFLKALSQFMVMCVSSNAKYDSMRKGEVSFTEAEQAGYITFGEKCNSCHKEPLFTDHSFRNNGLSISAVDDKGRFNVTLNESDKYKFRVPTLRNLSFTPTYMHDGRLLDLEGVLAHYATGIIQTPNLDEALKQGIQLTITEKANLLTFLKTLDDRSFITDKRFSE
jgi:cytochrome c peroxidase